MTDQQVRPKLPGGYKTGAEALQNLVWWTRLFANGNDCRDRLYEAQADVTRLLGTATRGRADALEAVLRFAEEDPAGLGVTTAAAVDGKIDEMDGMVSDLEQEVLAIVEQAGRRPQR